MARIQCPKCGMTGKVRRSYVGLPVRCRQCETKFRASQSTGGKPTDEPPPSDFDLVDEDEVPTTIGRFQIRAWLGRGAFGDVYRAYDPVLDREVALKVPRESALDSPERVERFLREAKSAARLHHPH